ncbi:PAP9, partial [Symbiodinium microadriaticum]
WSYDIGLIHFVGMSTEHDYTVGSEQYIWIDEDLASVNRTKTPWIIFGGHRAMYLNSNYVDGVTSDGVVMDNLIANVEPLIWKYRVNLAFWGHNHVVQRQATVHMVIGTAGAKFTVNYVEPYPDWCEMVFYRYGYARVQATSASRLEWEWVSALDDVVYDRMIIDQSLDFSKSWVVDTDEDNSINSNDDDSDGLTALEK